MGGRKQFALKRALFAVLINFALLQAALAQAIFDSGDTERELRIKKGATFAIKITVAPTMAQTVTLKPSYRKVKLLNATQDYNDPADKHKPRLGCCLKLQTWTFQALESGSDSIVLINNHQDRISEYRFQLLIE